jgi:hypothetical protein
MYWLWWWFSSRPFQRQAFDEINSEGLREADDKTYYLLHPDGRPKRVRATWAEWVSFICVVAPFAGGAAVIVALFTPRIGMLAILAAIVVLLFGVDAARLTLAVLGRRRLRAGSASMAARRGIVT